MHVYTLLIAPNVTADPYEMAEMLAHGLLNAGFDWWTVGGRFSGLFTEHGITTADQRFPDLVAAYDLPDPLPDGLNPPGVLTPDAPYLWRPLQPSRRPAWDKRLARIIDGYRYGYSAVILDAHC
jgi:hypothetical protein